MKNLWAILFMLGLTFIILPVVPNEGYLLLLLQQFFGAALVFFSGIFAENESWQKREED